MYDEIIPRPAREKKRFGQESRWRQRRFQMSRRIRGQAPIETTIERIFEKVVGRKMNSYEKICFHIKRRIKPPPRVSADRESRAA
jgi:hypothetical protein